MSGEPCPHSQYFLPDRRGEAIKFPHSGYSTGQNNSRFLSSFFLFYASVPHAHSTQLACLLRTERFNGQSLPQTSQRTDFTGFRHSEVKGKELGKTRAQVTFHNTAEPRRSFQQSSELAGLWANIGRVLAEKGHVNNLHTWWNHVWRWCNPQSCPQEQRLTPHQKAQTYHDCEYQAQPPRHVRRTGYICGKKLHTVKTLGYYS